MKTVVIVASLVFLSGSGFAQPAAEWLEFFSQVPGQNEFVDEVTFDDAGNTYITGSVFQTGESTNIFTIKIDPDGSEVFRDSYNGAYNGAEEPYGMFVASDGYLYVTGRTQLDAASFTVVTIKYSPTGTREWAYVYPFPSLVAAQGNSVVTDDSGNVYVGGSVEGSGTTSGQDLLVLKLDSMGNHLDELLLTQVIGQADDCYDITVGADGNVYLTAFSFASAQDGYEILVMKIDPALNIFWLGHINGTDNSLNEFPVDLILDSSNNVHVLARIQNDGTGTDFATVKLNTLGQELWREEFDANGGQDIPEDMVLDDLGNVYVTGRARRTGYNDFAVIKYNSDGMEQWTTYYDGPNNLDDDPVGIAVDDGGTVWVCGESNRTGSNFEFIVAQFDPLGSFAWEWVYDVNASSKAYGVFNSGVVDSPTIAAGEGEGPGGDQDFMAVGIGLGNAVGIEDGVPGTFRLLQNYPNPFNPATVVAFDVGSRSSVTLAVYDLLGREVATLVNGVRDAGRHQAAWDATGMPSGVYVARLRAGDFVDSRKLVLLR
jgi:hypothetical protein